MDTKKDEVCFKLSKYVVCEPYRGLHLAYHAKKVYFSGQSKYQRIDLIENDAYGRMLLLDGNIQHTAFDCRIFNDALCGPAIRNKASRVILLGGGSGQTVLALLHSPKITRITAIEIDELVVDCCRKYIKEVRQALDDNRVRIVIGDAFDYLHRSEDEYDVAIIDLTERPFAMKNKIGTLKRLYSDIKDKCGGCCSQYIGSSVGLSFGPRLRSLADGISKQYLSNIRYEEAFIPSFGAPHTFMHAGYSS